jgi:hypothetical protein
MFFNSKYFAPLPLKKSVAFAAHSSHYLLPAKAIFSAVRQVGSVSTVIFPKSFSRVAPNSFHFKIEICLIPFINYAKEIFWQQ